MKKQIAWLKDHFDLAIFEMCVALACGTVVGLVMSSWSKVPGEQIDGMPLVFLGLFSMLLTVANCFLTAGYLFWRFGPSGRRETQT